MSTNYNGRIFTVGDTIYFSKFGTKIDGGYASASGTKGTCYGKITALYSGTYAFPIIIGGTITAGTGGSFTTAAVKPLDCSKGYQVMVIYDNNDGSGKTSSQTGYVNASLTGTASRTGYTFNGWYTSYSGGSKVTTFPANETRYYAHWTAKTYKVTFNANGGSGSESKTETYDSNYVLPSNPTRTGYTFSGWYTKQSSGSRVTSSTKMTTAAAHTLYAHWTPHTYTVTFNGNGASGSSYTQSFTYGVSKALTANAFSRGSAYRFTGWNKNSAGTSTSYSNQQTVSNLTSTDNGNVNLYAQWELQYLAPTITNISAIRSDSSGTAQDDGAYLHLTATCKANTSISSSNTITTVVIKKKTRSATSWSTEYTYSGLSVATYPLNYISSSASFNTDTVYDLRIEVTDSYGTSTGITAPQAKATTFLSKAFFTMDFATGGYGVGIGTPAPSNGLDVGLKTTFYNEVYTSTIRTYDSTDGVWLRARLNDAPNGDTTVMLGVGANSDNRGVYLPAKGSASAVWLIREYWASGTPRIEIGGSDTNGVWLMGHNSAIGSYTTGSGEASIANSTSIITKWKKITTLAAGSWVIMCSVRFTPSAASGSHAFSIACGDTTHQSSYAAGINGTTSTVAECFSTLVSNTASLDVYINARQNSGASVTASYYWRVMRIA